MKNGSPFLGVKMAAIRSAVHQWHGAYIAPDLDLEEQVDLALALFQGPFTEEKLAGTLSLAEILLPAGALPCVQDVDRLAALFHEGMIYDWNVCDWFCVKLLGPLIKREGARVPSASPAGGMRRICGKRGAHWWPSFPWWIRRRTTR